MKRVALALLAVAWLLGAEAGATPVTTAEDACAMVKTRVSARNHSPERIIAFCDVIDENDSPTNLYIMGLHSTRECDGICSTLMGWFAVRKDNGQVYEWYVAEWKLGPLVG